jgi:hypothetical protein
MLYYSFCPIFTLVCLSSDDVLQLSEWADILQRLRWLESVNLNFDNECHGIISAVGVELNRIEYSRAGTEGLMHSDHNPSFVQPSSSNIRQSHILNKVHYPADRDVITVTWWMTQVSESWFGQILTVTKNICDCFRCLLASVTEGPPLQLLGLSSSPLI